MKTIAFAALVVINAFVFARAGSPEELLVVKEKYRRLREHLVATKNEKFKTLWSEKPITGYMKMSGSIGHNTNKGADIAVCLDGTPNQVFHVLLHELAHCTVKEYEHSTEFWKNYVELRDIAIEIGIYDKIPHRQPFCGQHIQDGDSATA